MAHSMMTIGKPYIEETATRSRLYSQIFFDGNPVYTVWYEVESKYAPYLCAERIDGLVVNLLLYAVEYGYDISSECEMSEKLYYQLVEYLIPSISANIQKYGAIDIIAPLTQKPIYSVGGVGACLSGGVDSFYTLFRHINRQESSFEITHLCFFNSGHSGGKGGEKARLRHFNRIAWIKSVADEMGKELLCVDTNINEFLNQNHRATHIFRTLAVVLVLQKLFSKYYFASSTPFTEFGFSDITTGSYDLLTTKCISTESLEFYVSGGEVSRLDKLVFLLYGLMHLKIMVIIFRHLKRRSFG